MHEVNTPVIEVWILFKVKFIFGKTLFYHPECTSTYNKMVISGLRARPRRRPSICICRCVLAGIILALFVIYLAMTFKARQNRKYLILNYTKNLQVIGDLCDLNPQTKGTETALILYPRTPSIGKPNSGDFTNEAELRQIYAPFTAIEVLASGQFLNRVKLFNEQLDRLRLEALRSRGGQEWISIAPTKDISLIWTARDDFLKLLGSYSQLRLVMLPWDKSAGTGKDWSSLKDESNLLIQNYYEWTADDPLCKWIETPGTIKMKYDVTYNRTCVRDSNRSITPQSMNTLVLNAKPINSKHYWPNEGNAFPSHFYTEQPPFAFYVYLIRDGIVTKKGDVYTGNVKLVQYSCSHYIDLNPPANIHEIPLHDEIFPVAQYWGTGQFHRIVEVIPRLSLYIDFLKRNPNIKILASETGGRTAELVKILGLSENRLISGTFRAKLIYLPRSTMCGTANVQELQMFSMICRKYITENLQPEPRNKIILIRRSFSRRFTKQKEIEKVVESAAKAYNLRYVMFKDNPAPSLNHIMQMFHSAVMVVAPHGAGLANVVFSQPGTNVIEGVCNLPHVNFCFQRLSYVLGHHWHGVPSRGGCLEVVDVSSESIEKAVLTFLAQMKL